jgi:hypothetical protein
MQQVLANIPSAPAFIEAPMYRYPRTDIPAAQQRAFRRQQAEEMARGMLGFWPPMAYTRPQRGMHGPLYDIQEQAFNLDDLVEAVMMSDATALKQARDTAQFFLSDYLDDQVLYAPLLGAPKIDLGALLAPYEGSIRLFFAAPKMFPLIGYLVAAHAWCVRERRLRLPESRPFLVTMTADRLARRQKSRPPDDDTWLLLLLSLYCPADSDEQHL